MNSRRLPRAALAALVSAVLALSACSGGSDGELGPDERLAAAKKALDETSGVQLLLEAESLPRGVEGLLRAEGVGTHDPAFQGTIKVAASGVTADVEIIAVEGAVHAKLPFTQDFVKIDPADYGAPDPADLMSSEGGLSSLLTDTEDAEEGDQVRDGDDVLTEVSGTVPGSSVARVIPSADEQAQFDAVFTLDAENRLDAVQLTGPFYPDTDAVTYTVEFADYGVDKEIVAP